MKTMLEVCMYSGMCQWDPRCEITPEQNTILLEKLDKLHKKAEANRFGTGVLGSDSFAVAWGVVEIKEDGFTFVDDYEKFLEGLRITGLHAWPGRVQIYHKVDGVQQTDMYEDTEGVHEFLAAIAVPAIETHQERARKRMAEYWDNFNPKV